MSRLSPWSTSGSQKCMGAIPIFNARAIERSVAEPGLIISLIIHWPVSQAFIVPANRTRAEAVACVRKYFVVASVARGWCW